MFIIGSRPLTPPPNGANRALTFGNSPFQHVDKDVAMAEAKRLLGIPTTAPKEYVVFQLVAGVTAEVQVTTKEEQYI